MNKKLELILVEDDKIASNEMNDAISDVDFAVLIASTDNSGKALKYILNYQPDVLILDLELHSGSGNGVELLHKLNTSELQRKPYIIITTNNSSTITYDMVRNLGADFIMYKHQTNYSARYVLDFIKIMYPSIIEMKENSVKVNSSEISELPQKGVYKLIYRELNSVGINPKSIGYTYLADGIMSMIIERTQNICSIIAKMHSKSETSVERAMQYAINKAWNTTDINDLINNYTAPINSIKGTPTITEFVCYYANKLKDN